MKSLKKWIISILATISLTLLAIMGLNYYVDSYWSFNHSHIFEEYQRGNRERQQKSNALFFRDQKYNTVIFGSSRTAYMDQNTWDDTTFNYAASDMQPSEYKPYLDFAINEAKQPIKRVIIGLDFFGGLEYASPVSSQSDSILSIISSPLYRYKLLLSRDALDYSIKNIKYYFTQPTQKYNSENIKISQRNINVTEEEYLKSIQGGLEGYVRDRYSYPYDMTYKETIQNLINSYPDIEFIVFTTPVSKVHFNTIQSSNLYTLYERWIEESVEVFTKVHHFMYLNELTSSPYLYFLDSNHGFNSTYDCLTLEILGKDSSCPKSNMTITKENVDDKLKALRILNGIN